MARIFVFLVLLAVPVAARAAAENPPPIVVLDFEDPSDRRRVESRRRAVLSGDVSSHGRSSLRVQAGDYLNIRSPRLGEARRGDLLKIDFFNARSVPQPVRAELFDVTSKKGYWYRHVRQYALRPGWSTLCFRVARLYRGEKNSRRIRDAYLDPARLERIDLAFRSARERGFIHVDYIRFERDPPMPAVEGLRAFDFGPANQAVRHGFTPCSREVYDAERGYGWSGAGWPRAVRDYVHPNDLLGDFREARGETFSVRVPNGAYRVRVYYEDHGWWEDQFARFTWRTISAEGKPVHAERLSPEQAARRFLRFADTEPGATTDVYGTYIRDGRYKPKEFDADVKDGRLDVRFDADRPMVCRVSAIVLWPTSGAAAAAQWCAELDRRMRQEFEAENVYTETSPRGRSASDVPLAAWRGGFVFFSAGGTVPTGPGYQPVKDEVLSGLELFSVPGRDVGASFSVRPLLGGRATIRAAVPGLACELLLVQNRLRRHLGGYTVVPDILRPIREVTLAPGATRQVWLEIAVAPDVKPGRYAGEVSVEFRGLRRKWPISVDVLPIRLSEPTFAFGLFGLLPDASAPPGALEKVVGLLRRHGLSSVAGVPLGRVVVRDGEARVDFAEADRVMGALKKAGFRLGVDTYGGGGLRGVAGVAAALKRSRDDVFRQAMGQVRAHAKAEGWLPVSYSMVDEPQWSDEAVAGAARAVRRVGAAAPGLLTNGYWSPRADNPAHRELMDALGRTMMGRIGAGAVRYLRARGKPIGFYGGCSRHEFGLKQWSAAGEGLSAHYAWHFYVRYGDLYYDLDAREPDVCMVYYTPTEVRPSLRLKAVRAGAYDFLYLQTLADALKNAGDGPAAAAARQLLDKAKQAGNMYRRGAGPEVADRDAFRRQVAGAIVTLTGGGKK